VFAVLVGLFLPGARFGVFGVVLVLYIFVIFGSSLVIPLATKMKQRAEATMRQQQEQLRELEEKTEGSKEQPQPTP
jgi:uncharacterized membrane protein